MDPADLMWVADQLADCDDGEAVALALPFQDDAALRRRALDSFAAIVAELRAGGWVLDVSVIRKPDGEAFLIEPVAAPPTRTEEVTP